MRIATLVPMFLTTIPEKLEEGVLYISEEHNLAIHNCCCGCGIQTVTPLRHGRWSLARLDGAVSLFPSIGNGKFPCRSHYWIKQNQVEWL